MVTFLDGLPPNTPWPAMAVGGHLLILVIGLVLAAFLLLLVATAATKKWIWMRLRCPQKDRSAEVTFRVDSAGKPEDIVRCSLLPPGKPIECGKRCLHTSALSAATPATSPEAAILF